MLLKPRPRGRGPVGKTWEGETGKWVAKTATPKAGAKGKMTKAKPKLGVASEAKATANSAFTSAPVAVDLTSDAALLAMWP